MEAEEVTWTKHRPTRPGWYWYQAHPDDPPVVMHLIASPGYDSRKLVRQWDNYVESAVTYYRGQWAGPISPPK